MNIDGRFAHSQPHYEGQGWIQWPDFPEVSQQFLRTLGGAQEGAATISECFQAASRILPDDLGSWYREWHRVGDVNAVRANAALASGHVSSAKASFLRAGGYYRASELFLEPVDARRAMVFSKVLACSEAYLRLISPAGEAVSICLDNETLLDAYFLKPANGPNRWPAVICFGGLDGYKDELLPKLSGHMLSRGLALLLVDMPGQGGALRLRGTPNRPDSEVPVSSCVEYLLTRVDVDPARIGLYGASLGGIYSARAASAEARIAAVVSDSLVFDLHERLSEQLFRPDTFSWRYLAWVFGCRSPEEVLDKCLQFRMAGFVGKIRCPYLIVQGEHDFLGLQTARDAFAFAKASGVPVEFRVFTGEETAASHCQADNPTLGQEYICDWMADQLGVAQTAHG